MSDLKNELKKLGVNMLIKIPVIIILAISYSAGYVCAAAISGFSRGFHEFVRDTEKIGDSNEC